ncbi:glutathione S-transferase [Roseivivax halodurans JCM 10272]|uniref:Glutathione S-transferase n=1 Tax=Roseivivax halodurans JCM 10272 TaxID=1449350 RepID=X7EJW3_9RHOB|nr:glutathione S-transferase family protein [Roseivivax halodurans]ETX15413.1 glutathione S-transferase [Roseivivax halodurans JCM 10272]
MSYTLIGSGRTRAFRALWMLEELGADYTHVPAAPRAAEVTQVSPLGKVPVLIDGDHVIPDSGAILHYLADRHGALTYPAGTPERARQDAWTFRILDELDALLWTAARHSFVLPEAERVPEIKDAVKHEVARNFTRIAAEIPGPFVMGETMTVADILLCHCGSWAVAAKVPDLPPAMRDWSKPLRDRPAFKRAAEKA